MIDRRCLRSQGIEKGENSSVLARESSTKEETPALHQGYHNLHDKTKEEEFNKDRRSKLYTADSSSKLNNYDLV